MKYTKWHFAPPPEDEQVMLHSDKGS
jgi:hypothetical protein